MDTKLLHPLIYVNIINEFPATFSKTLKGFEQFGYFSDTRSWRKFNTTSYQQKKKHSNKPQ